MFYYFDKKIFFRNFFLILALLGIIFNVAIIFFDYELMQFDIPGSILTAALLANLWMLLGKQK